MAKLIAFEGIDGSGKGTQAQKLHDGLRDAGVSCTLISFPRYQDTLFGEAVGEFLNGKFGELDAVHPFLASLLYAGDRRESLPVLQQAAAEFEVVVLDRYVASNMAHQGAKLHGSERDRLLRRIARIEFELNGLPTVDLNILLDIPAETAQQLIARKQARSYTEREADLQEADLQYLQNVAEVYRQLAREESNWQVIDCTQPANDPPVRSIDDIGAEIYDIVQRSL